MQIHVKLKRAVIHGTFYSGTRSVCLIPTINSISDAEANGVVPGWLPEIN